MILQLADNWKKKTTNPIRNSHDDHTSKQPERTFFDLKKETFQIVNSIFNISFTWKNVPFFKKG